MSINYTFHFKFCFNLSFGAGEFSSSTNSKFFSLPSISLNCFSIWSLLRRLFSLLCHGTIRCRDFDASHPCESDTEIMTCMSTRASWTERNFLVPCENHFYLPFDSCSSLFSLCFKLFAQLSTAKHYQESCIEPIFRLRLFLSYLTLLII